MLDREIKENGCSLLIVFVQFVNHLLFFEIKKNINRRDFLKKKAIQTNSTACYNAYKSLRNKISKQIIHAKRHYYTDCIDRNKNNTKQMWKNINHLINKESKSTNISLLQMDDQIVVESVSMSNLFNEYFTDIGQLLSSAEALKVF